MEIPGLATSRGQPTLTNPLSRESLLEGQISRVDRTGEAQNTVTAREQPTTTVGGAGVVNQAGESASTGLDTRNFGGKIDITV